MVPRTLSTVLPALKVKNFAAVCPLFFWRKKTPRNPPLWPGQDRAVAPGLVRQFKRGLAVLAQRYRQTDRCLWLADTAACLHGVSPLEGRRSVNCQVCFCPILSHFQIPIQQIMRLQRVSWNALTHTELNGQGNAFSLQCSRFRKWFLNNLILAAHLVIPSLSHGRCSS